MFAWPKVLFREGRYLSVYHACCDKKRCGLKDTKHNPSNASFLNEVTSHQFSIVQSTWFGVAEGQTLKLDFVMKRWQDQKKIFGILIYALCRFQNYKNHVGCIDTLNNHNLLFPSLTGYDDLGQTHDFGKSGYHTSVSPSQSKSNSGLWCYFHHHRVNLIQVCDVIFTIPE